MNIDDINRRDMTRLDENLQRIRHSHIQRSGLGSFIHQLFPLCEAGCSLPEHRAIFLVPQFFQFVVVPPGQGSKHQQTVSELKNSKTSRKFPKYV